MVQAKTGEEEGNEKERNKSKESRKSNRSSHSSGGEESADPKSKSVGVDFDKYMILEYAENGDLFDFTIAIQEPMGEDLARYYFL